MSLSRKDPLFTLDALLHLDNLEDFDDFDLIQSLEGIKYIDNFIIKRLLYTITLGPWFLLSVKLLSE